MTGMALAFKVAAIETSLWNMRKCIHCNEKPHRVMTSAYFAAVGPGHLTVTKSTWTFASCDKEPQPPNHNIKHLLPTECVIFTNEKKH